MVSRRAGRTIVIAGGALLVLSVATAANAEPDDVTVSDGAAEDSVLDLNVDDSILSLGVEESVSPLLLEESIEPLAVEDVTGDETTVTVSSDVLFDFDESELTSRAESTIAGLADDLAQVTGAIEVVGHTDGVGEASYNQRLSEERADAVADALRDQLDGDAEIEASGRGMDEPAVEETEDNPDAAAQNRRVEIRYGG